MIRVKLVKYDGRRYNIVYQDFILGEFAVATHGWDASFRVRVGEKIRINPVSQAVLVGLKTITQEINELLSEFDLELEEIDKQDLPVK